jgi:hypothetical protein
VVSCQWREAQIRGRGGRGYATSEIYALYEINEFYEFNAFYEINEINEFNAINEFCALYAFYEIYAFNAFNALQSGAVVVVVGRRSGFGFRVKRTG